MPSEKLSAISSREHIDDICHLLYQHSEGVRDCCLKPNEKIFSYIMARTSYIRWDDDDVRLVLDQHLYHRVIGFRAIIDFQI